MSEKQKILMSGLPGKMAVLITEALLSDDEEKFQVHSEALTGPNQPWKISLGKVYDFYLKNPETHESFLQDLLQIRKESPIIVDFSQPDVVNRNAELFCKYQIPFVIGTTGGDRKKLEQTVIDSKNIAVIAPNMAYPVVLIQSMLEKAAQEFPNILEEFSLSVEESHQTTKKDTSGTAKAMVSYFNKLGISFTPEQIIMHRNPEFQRERLGIPSEYLNGHGWHTYSISSRDGSVLLEFKHNINGRQPYVQGTLKALDFLVGKIKAGKMGEVYSMIDVMREN